MKKAESPIPSTTEILAFKVLNRYTDKRWVDWAVDMLMAGFDTEHLCILAGESEPLDFFEMQSLTTKVLAELDLDYSDRDQIILNYVIYLIDQALAGEMDGFAVLSKLKDLHMEQDLDYLYNFYLLYWAKDDLLEMGQQGYWIGATRQNIDRIVEEQFIQFKANGFINFKEMQRQGQIDSFSSEYKKQRKSRATQNMGNLEHRLKELDLSPEQEQDLLIKLDDELMFEELCNAQIKRQQSHLNIGLTLLTVGTGITALGWFGLLTGSRIYLISLGTLASGLVMALNAKSRLVLLRKGLK